LNHPYFNDTKSFLRKQAKKKFIIHIFPPLAEALRSSPISSNLLMNRTMITSKSPKFSGLFISGQ